MQKKSQISIVILLGVVLLTSFFFLNSIKSKDTVSSDNVIHITSSVTLFTESCIKENTRQALFDLGMTDLDKIEVYLNNNIKECTSDYSQFKDFKITQGVISTNINIDNFNNSLTVKTTYPLTIEKGRFRKEISDFYFKYPLTNHILLDVNNGLTSSNKTVFSKDMIATLSIPEGTNASYENGTPLERIDMKMTNINGNSGYTIGFIAYDLTPDGSKFDPPLQISIKYDESLLSPAVSERNLKISYFDDETWVSFPSWVDTSKNTIYANVSHFTSVAPTSSPNSSNSTNDSLVECGGSKIDQIGVEETVGSGGRIPSIATDTLNNPHIASDVGGQGRVLLFHKTTGSWTGSPFDTGGYQFYNPEIVINNFNQAWVSGVKWHPDAMGLIYFEDIAVNPVVTDYISSVKGGHCCLPIGLIGINPTKKDECVVWAGNGGYYEIFGVSSNRLSSLGTGYMESGKGGEVNSFSISKDGTVWHAATGVYQNSLRNAAGQGVIGWSNYMVGGNSGTGDDGEYQALTSDLEDPKVAYIASSRGGGHEKAIVNIFDGSKFLFGPSEHYVLDNSAAYFANGLRRYSPQVAPAQGGGAFVCWTHSNNHIYIKYISPEGVSKFGPTKDIGPGNTCAITTDSDGQIHIAYNNNGVKYRKIETY